MNAKKLVDIAELVLSAQHVSTKRNGRRTVKEHTKIGSNYGHDIGTFGYEKTRFTPDSDRLQSEITINYGWPLVTGCQVFSLGCYLH